MGEVRTTANHDDTLAHLTALLPVLRELNRATQRLAMALPGQAHPVGEAPTVDQALSEVNAAIDDYCAVTLEYSGILPPDREAPDQEAP